MNAVPSRMAIAFCLSILNQILVHKSLMRGRRRISLVATVFICHAASLVSVHLMLFPHSAEINDKVINLTPTPVQERQLAA